MQNGFRVGDSHQVEPSLNSVTGPAGTIRLEPKVMQVLVLLAAHAGQVVAKEHLIRTVWPDVFVSDDVLTRAISELRRVFGDDAKESRFIQTIPKTGYRLIARVANGAAEDVAATAHAARIETTPRSWTRAAWVIGLALVMLAGVLVWRWQDARRQVSPVMIAVLPFEHLGGDPEREYLTDGLTEEISASLGQIGAGHLSVKGRTSTKMYKRTKKSPADIGRELGVEYVVEGSVQTESGRLRVTAKLIRVRDQVQMWAESFDSEPGSMLELQRQLSAGIARKVHLRLSPDWLTALARRHTQDAEAYDFYLRGRHFWKQLTPETNRRAVASYLRATELDPGFALAWSGLADIYSASPMNSDVAPLEVAQRARDAIAHAVASGPDLAETQTALGTVHYWLDWDWPAAETAFRKAVLVDPSYSQAHRVLGIVLAYLRRHDEARAEMGRARGLEPLAPAELALSAHVEFAARDFTAALQFAEQAALLAPEFWIGQFQLAQVYEQLGDRESMRRALEITERFSHANSKMISLRGYVLSRLGRTIEAREILRTLETLARERYVPPYSMALVQAGLGERDAALQSLERALQARDVNLVFLAVDPKWDSFRSDPRFLDLLNRCPFMRRASTVAHTGR